MMYKENCWEFKSCGRQPGGDNAEELGVCPVAICFKADGINGGINGGRACWAIEGSLCGGELSGNFTQKLSVCMNCEFYSKVRHEEGQFYISSKEILKRIKPQGPNNQDEAPGSKLNLAFESLVESDS